MSRGVGERRTRTALDPDAPSLVVLRLAGLVYADESHVTGSDVYETREPFPVGVVRAELTFYSRRRGRRLVHADLSGHLTNPPTTATHS